VVNGYSNSVTELDASTGAFVQTIPVGSGPYGVSSDGTDVWVANNGSNLVTELDASTGAFVQTIPVGTAPLGISSDGTDVWVANSGSNSVTELDASTGALVQTIGVGSSPDGVSSDGTHVCVANFSSDTVTELNASTGGVVSTVKTGSDPTGVSSDGINVWVANEISDSVTELDPSFESIIVPSLPAATPGMAYGPVTLQAANVETSPNPYTTTLKWKKVALPKGFKLSSAGVLSGTPNKHLAAGSSSITVQVTETVTTLNGRMKVKTPTTVQATIPLTIT
jgi:YVTN family beta-propeller protein